MDADLLLKTSRRGFMGRLSALAAALGLGSAPTVLSAATGATRPSAAPEFEAWLDGINGKHKQVFDAVSVNDGASGGFARTWMNTMRDTYELRDSELSGVIVVRHAGVVLSLGNAIWEKYKIGERYKIMDPVTKEPAIRNPYAYVKPGELQSDDAALDKLVERGVKIAACGVALAGRSSAAAAFFKMDKDEVKKEWIAGLLPGVMVAPSGVLAVHRSQEKGCTYCYAG